MTDTIIIFTDGSCVDNYKSKDWGIGGFGYTLKLGSHKKEVYRGRYINTSTNRMELMAVVEALKEIRLINGKNRYHIVVHIDRQSIVKTINCGWIYNWIDSGKLLERPDGDLWEEFMDIYNRLGGRRMVTLKWCRGHSGIPENDLVDKLANKGRLNKKIMGDHGKQNKRMVKVSK